MSDAISHFTYDVFFSYSSGDKTIVRDLATRLRDGGLRVWIEDDAVPVEQALDSSRTLVLCISAHALSAFDWPTLDIQQLRFRDPQNNDRRFILVRLDDSRMPESLQQLFYVDWRRRDEHEYQILLGCCRSPSRGEGIAKPDLAQKAISLGHAGALNSVTFSPDGRLALTGSDDHTVRLWDVETGLPVRVLEGHSGCVWSVALSFDGRLVLSGSDDGTVRIWDTETGRQVRVREDHASVLSVAFSPDGRLALSGAYDPSARLWDVETGETIRELRGHSARLRSVVFSPDGRSALSGSADCTLRLWDLESGRTLSVLRGHLDRVWSAAFSPDGRHGLSGSSDSTMRLWDLTEGQAVHVFEGHLDRVESVAFSFDGRLALSGSGDSTVRVWEVTTGQPVHVLEGHSDNVRSVAFSRDGRLAISASKDGTARVWDVASGHLLRVLEGHSKRISSMAFSSDGRLSISSSEDARARLWEVTTGRARGVMEGHSDKVWSVAFSTDGRRALSGSEDQTVRLWDVETCREVHAMKGHSASVWSVTFSRDGQMALSGSADYTVRQWEVSTGRQIRALVGHVGRVSSVSFSPDSRMALSGSDDRTVRLWDTATGSVVSVLEGHSDKVLCVAFSPDGQLAISGSDDCTLRLWEVATGRALRVMEGHSSGVWSAAFSPDGRLAVSGSSDTVRLWDIAVGRAVRVLECHAGCTSSIAFSYDGQLALTASARGVLRIWDFREYSAHARQESQTQYTNAKVLLVGDSGVGKTGLSLRLSLDRWEPTDSTIGAWSTQMKLPTASSAYGDGVEREIWLWDFGGQADQRLIHQLYMEDTALAVLVFDGQKLDLFEALGQWDRDITRGSRKPFPKLLAAGRVDSGGLRVGRAEVEQFALERGFQSPLFETSAKTAIGCAELKEAIVSSIDWSAIAERSSPKLYKLLKDEILHLKDLGRVLMRLNELRDALQLRLANHNVVVQDNDVRAVVALLKGPGVVWQLDFGSWVLLQPELINAYAQAVILTLRSDPHERGMIAEERVLHGELVFSPYLKRLPADEERILLLAMHTTLLERGICLREKPEKAAPVLVFPSYYRRERPELESHPAVLVSYRFHGFLDDIYSSLVVRLHHTDAFEHDALWRYAADFKTVTNKKVGIKLTRMREGGGQLEVYSDPKLPIEGKMLFCRFVHEHLMQKARDIERLRCYTCPHCDHPVRDRELAAARLREGGANARMVCVSCEKRIPLWDELEELVAGPDVRAKALSLAAQSQAKLDSESKDRALVGEVVSTVALAGQISREFSVSDHGIDMEIEFKDDSGAPTGQKLYLQLKSGDSYVRTRKRDDAEVFDIRKPRHVQYWMNQVFPVMLVHRTSEGLIRWMEIRDLLRRESIQGTEPVKQIVFDGERFDALSVRRWRDRVLLGRSFPIT